MQQFVENCGGAFQVQEVAMLKILTINFSNTLLVFLAKGNDLRPAKDKPEFLKDINFQQNLFTEC